MRLATGVAVSGAWGPGGGSGVSRIPAIAAFSRLPFIWIFISNRFNPILAPREKQYDARQYVHGKASGTEQSTMVARLG